MKQYLIPSSLSVFLFWAVFLNAQPIAPPLYDDARISKIFIHIPPDSFQFMLKNLVHTRYMRADLVYERDTIRDIGIRLRGNTSLNHRKKSFKISFDEFAPDRTYQGMSKLNLRGSANDPTMVREKLFYDIWEKADMPERHTAFAELYVNKQYMGLYTNLEEIDKNWLQKTYGNNDGNLYKCTWPADLAYLGEDQQKYKAIMNNPFTRAYDLVTNEKEDDYERFVLLLKTLNEPVDDAFAYKITAMLNVESVLKSYAIDVATGNWDDYFYNKNNFYLYDHPETGKFEFFTFDTDNSLGVDWVNRDWAKRDLSVWHRTGEPRPLITKLLEVPQFKQQYLQYLNDITENITHPDAIFPRIDDLRRLITPSAMADTYRTLDYGYSMNSFYDGFEKAVDVHTPYGIKPFLVTRYVNTRNQLTSILRVTATDAAGKDGNESHLSVYPNPCTDRIALQPKGDLTTESLVYVALYDAQGRLQASWEVANGAQGAYASLPATVATGTYFLKWHMAHLSGQVMLLKN